MNSTDNFLQSLDTIIEMWSSDEEFTNTDMAVHLQAAATVGAGEMSSEDFLRVIESVDTLSC